MKLRTSFFNFAVLRKNLARFAPLWILYTVGEVLGLLMLNLEAPVWAADELNYIMGPVSIFHAVYALLVAACLFGDLFDPRLCNGLHAMPMRREGWLLTNLASGLVFALIPAIVGGAVGAAALGAYYWVALVWQGTSLLQFLFFFGVAVFSAMCAGKRLGMVAIYAILNFLSMLIYWVATMIYEPLLPGVVLSDDWYVLCCPVVTMTGDEYLDLEVLYNSDVLGLVFNGYIPDAWYYLYICAGVGAVFTVLAWLLYRKRHLETAGDFISFRSMRIFFLIAYTFAAGALLYSFGELFGMYKDYGFLVVGILIGWFTGWMLLERTVKIFTKKVLVGFAAFAVLFAGSIGLTILDPLGMVTYMPRSQEIANVCLYPLNYTYYYNVNTGYMGWYITDPEEIAEVQALHKQMIETPEDPDGETINQELCYQLENGFSVYRSYKVPSESEVAEDLGLFLSDVRSVFATGDFAQVKDTVEYAVVYMQGGSDSFEIDDPEQLQALLAAIEADCKAGNFAQHDYFHLNQEYMAGIDIRWEVTYKSSKTTSGKITDTRSEHVMVYEDCENVIAFLNTLDAD